MAPSVLTDEQALYKLVGSYAEAFLFVGFSEKAMFDSIADAVKQLDPFLQASQKRCNGKPFLAIYGGDPADKDTIGRVMKEVKGKYSCHVMAMQAAGKHEDWVDHVFICGEQYETVKKVKDGQEVEVKEILYGGTRNGKPVGGARFYMGEQFYGRPKEGVKGLITMSFFMGGGAIAAEEMAYCDAYGAPWTYVPCKAKNFAAYNSFFGPVHEWVVKRVAEGAGSIAAAGNIPHA
uniref:Uncharacterized protein n=1 Tax=Chlamydomonas leiostraca TaxID=1034604 RepID=A0A7S0RZR1_9CHLO|mmetsp:Transcript_35341/g.89475  ORF Transcript_35341/g.89475 Transcript_35341/m.89475 type:complete len:234 (+) Transcript_35341:39-740(+)|eukprot:CAMPEP_0202869342 /NCGR_PEP_ID=MMETSP1391-20130828/12404_1 /ASSEMBLY_ACC=CAM_ASM_000867 /TAXON_ID=1034604 /ORGANISM="Chlamydomonas leiostraca, Strain SAG 11-49" /LENGTH=233 /DNA_ID=CAMNT_0049549655 /DNA_START=20 /DNA_END=721 /DNA_ORIENTATION=-